MLLKYKCPKCNSIKILTVPKQVMCQNCNVLYEKVYNTINLCEDTTEESRYMADEAIYNTIGKRIQNNRVELEDE